MTFLHVVKKQLWVLDILFVVLAAYLTANAINMHVREKIDVQQKIDLAAKSGRVPAARPGLEDYQVVLDRNIFNSASALKARLKKAVDNLGIDITSADLQLLGTIAGRPRVSLALIAQKSKGNQVKVYTIGENVGNYTVSSIEPRLVRLDKEGQEEILRMPTDPSELAKINTDFEATQVADGIRQISDDTIQVDRNLVEDSFENMGKLMRQARVMPHLKNGKIDGFKVYRIKENSLYKKIGLVNGDIIKRVNGMEIQGPEDGLKLFDIFKNSKSISLDLERNGKRKTINYRVQ